MISRVIHKLKEHVTKPAEELLAFDSPTDKKIGEILFERGEVMLPKDIKPELKKRDANISQRAIYKRLRKMNDSGIVEHTRGEGYRIALGRRYFPFVSLSTAVLSFGLGIWLWNRFAMAMSLLFLGSLFFYWKHEF